MDWTPHVRRVIAQLGEDVTYTHAGTGYTVRGLFLLPYQAAELGGVGITGTNPRLAAMTADLPGVAPGDTITRSAIVYTVKVKQPDDPGGFTVLDLKR